MACRTLSSMLPVTSPPSMCAIVLFRYAAAIAIASCSNRSPQITTMSGSSGVEAVGELERGQARGLRHRHVIAALDHVEERRRDREAAGLDVVGDVAAVLVEQDRAAEHQLELDVRMRVQLLDQQLAAAVVGAAGDRKADSALAARGILRVADAASCHGRRARIVVDDDRLPLAVHVERFGARLAEAVAGILDAAKRHVRPGAVGRAVDRHQAGAVARDELLDAMHVGV